MFMKQSLMKIVTALMGCLMMLQAQEDTAKVMILPIEKNPKPVPTFFSATAEVQARRFFDRIETETSIRYDLHQGKADRMSLSLTGQGEITEVSGDGVMDWSIRQDAAGLRFLAACGPKAHDEPHELSLLSDTLGLSMLVTALGARKPKGCTESTLPGPFDAERSVQLAHGGDLARGAKGERCFVQGHVRALDGAAVAGAQIHVCHAGAEGVVAPAAGTLTSGADGGFHFKTIVAEPHTIPHDGPVGRMLQALGRQPWRPAHLHFTITAPGFERLVTHVFRAGDRYLDVDAVFAVRSSLVADWLHHPPGRMPDGLASDLPFYTLDFEFVLNATTGDKK